MLIRTNYKIKLYPWYFKYLPISDHAFTTFMSSTIYFNKDMYEELKNNNPKDLTQAVLLHQLVHIQNCGFKKFLKYVLIKSYRLEEEHKAFTEMFVYLKSKNIEFDLKKVAKNFSGIRYLWMLDYSNALATVEKWWKDA